MPLRDAKGSISCDRAFCRAILPRVSRTFALSIELLPTHLGDAVNVAYLLCRILDTIEDQEALAAPVRQELFAHIDGAIDDQEADLRPFKASVRTLGLGGTSPDADLCVRASSVFACYHDLPTQQREAIAPSVHAMGCGIRDFGLGLQLVNILKDAGQDFAAGRCFLPRQEAQDLGLDLGDLLNTNARPKALELVSLLATRAREHLDGAAHYTLSWPVEATHIRLFCAVPLLLARATLDEIDRGDNVLRPDRAPKISRLQVAQIVAAATHAIPNDDALTALLGPIDAAA